MKFYSGYQTAESKQEDKKRGVVNGECVLKPFCLKGSKSCYKAIQRRL